MVSVKLLSKNGKSKSGKSQKKTKRTRGGTNTKKRSLERSPQPRKSVRLSGNQTVLTKSLGPVPIGTYKSSTNKNISKGKIEEFIKNNITYGPQIVSLPVPDQRHAFIVDIQRDGNIIIVDWGGEKNKTRGIEPKPGKPKGHYNINWTTYSNFMLLLEEKFNKNIVYANIDTDLERDADKKDCLVNGGGCSHYAYAYAKKYYEQKNPNHSAISTPKLQHNQLLSVE